MIIASTTKIGMATERMPRTSPMVAVIRPGASAFASLRPYTPNTMALMPAAMETPDAIETAISGPASHQIK